MSNFLAKSIYILNLEKEKILFKFSVLVSHISMLNWGISCFFFFFSSSEIPQFQLRKI